MSHALIHEKRWLWNAALKVCWRVLESRISRTYGTGVTGSPCAQLLLKPTELPLRHASRSNGECAVHRRGRQGRCGGGELLPFQEMRQPVKLCSIVLLFTGSKRPTLLCK